MIFSRLVEHRIIELFDHEEALGKKVCPMGFWLLDEGFTKG